MSPRYTVISKPQDTEKKQYSRKSSFGEHWYFHVLSKTCSMIFSSWTSTLHMFSVKAFEKFWTKDTVLPQNVPILLIMKSLSSVMPWMRSTKYVIWARNRTSLSHYFLICKKDNNTSLFYLTRWLTGENALVFVNHMHCWLYVIITTKSNSEFRHFVLHGNKKK